MRAVVALLVLLSAAPAAAEPVISTGLDGGVTFYESNIEKLDGPETQEGTGISLGLDLLNFMWAFGDFMVGASLEGSFFQAGPEPSPAIEFMFGPRLAWRAHDWLHLQGSVGVLMSTFDDRCSGSFDPPICDEPTRPGEPTSIGYGFTFSPLLPFDFGDIGTLLIGPTVRHRSVNVNYEDGADQFYVRTWQVALGAHFMIRLVP